MEAETCGAVVGPRPCAGRCPSPRPRAVDVDAVGRPLASHERTPRVVAHDRELHARLSAPRADDRYGRACHVRCPPGAMLRRRGRRPCPQHLGVTETRRTSGSSEGMEEIGRRQPLCTGLEPTIARQSRGPECGSGQRVGSELRLLEGTGVALVSVLAETVADLRARDARPRKRDSLALVRPRRWPSHRGRWRPGLAPSRMCVLLKGNPSGSWTVRWCGRRARCCPACVAVCPPGRRRARGRSARWRRGRAGLLDRSRVRRVKRAGWEVAWSYGWSARAGLMRSCFGGRGGP